MCPEIISQYFKISEHRYTRPSKSGEDNNIIISVDFKLLMTENPKHFILVLTLEKSIKAFLASSKHINSYNMKPE